jgi:hypothetical protein
VQQISGKTGRRSEISDVYERSRRQKSGTVLHRSAHDNGDGSLVIRIPPCLLRDIFTAITILESKVKFVVIQARTVLCEMAITPEVTKNHKLFLKLSNSI